MPIWGVVNQKGGVGKTTTSVNFATSLAQRGLRTLIVDCDPQGNASTGLGVDKAAITANLYDVLVETIDDPTASGAINEAIINVSEHLDILPATLDLAGAESALYNAVGKEMILREALANVRERYDWIVLDAPPSLGILTVNILAASDAVLVPMQCEFYALEGLTQLMKTIDIVRRRINPDLHIARVLLTMYDSRSRLNQQVTEEVRKYFGEKVTQTVIPRNIRLSEAPGFGEPAMTLYPTSKGAIAYDQFAKEVLATCAAL